MVNFMLCGVFLPQFKNNNNIQAGSPQGQVQPVTWRPDHLRQLGGRKLISSG